MNSRVHTPSTPSVRALLSLAALCLVYAPAVALAEPTTEGEVLIILAKEEGPTDAALEKIKPLQRPPFSSFKSKKLLKKAPVKLGKKAAAVELPNGQRLSLEMVGKKPDGRVELQLTIVDPKKKDGKPVLKVKMLASPGEPFFIAGQKHQGGTLFIGVQVGRAAEAAK